MFFGDNKVPLRIQCDSPGQHFMGAVQRYQRKVIVRRISIGNDSAVEIVPDSGGARKSFYRWDFTLQRAGAVICVMEDDAMESCCRPCPKFFL